MVTALQRTLAPPFGAKDGEVTATTYYNSINPNTTAIGAAVTATELTLNKG